MVGRRRALRSDIGGVGGILRGGLLDCVWMVFNCREGSRSQSSIVLRPWASQRGGELEAEGTSSLAMRCDHYMYSSIRLSRKLLARTRRPDTLSHDGRWIAMKCNAPVLPRAASTPHSTN